MLLTIGTIGNAGNNLKDSCLSTVIGSCKRRLQARDNAASFSTSKGLPQVSVLARGLFGTHLSCGLFVIPTLVIVLLAVLYNFLPTLGVMKRGRTNAVRRVGMAPIKGFAFVLTGLVPC